eukprot:TRINITY_DN6420_c1_g2_i1.p1 TRINITY_DN6420_c1_g2~~TRINITY_DN6420_c1_g2_i1.p1  ORF type:complete len:571 (-),score=59.21 TRINITY_DN6420_c1_g2_i1:374-2086(-)
MENQKQQGSNTNFYSQRSFDFLSQKSLDFPLDQLLDDAALNMDVDQLIQAPDEAFFGSYLNSLQAQVQPNPQVDSQPVLQQQLQQQQEQWVRKQFLQNQFFSNSQQHVIGSGPLTAVSTTLTPLSSGGGQTTPITTGALGNGPLSGGPQVVTTGDSVLQIPSADLSLDDLEWDGEEVQGQHQLNNAESTSLDKSKQKKKRIRSVQQQMQNKLAQQRYRERRKQKYTDMEEMVEQLQDQLETMKKVEKEFLEMQGQREQLQSLVQEQENEIARLRNQVKQLTLSGGLGVADEQLQKCENSEVIAGLVNEFDMDKVRDHFRDTVEQIKKIMDKYELLPSEDEQDREPAAVASVSAEDLRTLGTLVCRGIASCMKLYQDWSQPLMCPESRCNVRQNHMDMYCNVTCPIAKGQWEKCLRRIQLSKSQEAEILQQREKFLKQMREIYDQRDKLNLKAMGMMLPHWSKDYDPTAEGRMQTVQKQDFYYFLRWDAELGKVLDELRLNLREEQKAFILFTKSVMVNVLQLLQRAILFVTSFPLPVDILGVANTLNSQQQGASQTAVSGHSSQSASIVE